MVTALVPWPWMVALPPTTVPPLGPANARQLTVPSRKAASNALRALGDRPNPHSPSHRGSRPRKLPKSSVRFRQQPDTCSESGARQSRAQSAATETPVAQPEFLAFFALYRNQQPSQNRGARDQSVTFAMGLVNRSSGSINDFCCLWAAPRLYNYGHRSADFCSFWEPLADEPPDLRLGFLQA